MKLLNQNEIDKALKFIEHYQKESGVSPSVREITNELKCTIGKTQRYLKHLENKGYIAKDNSGRILTPFQYKASETVNVQLVGNVACGKPILAIEDIETTFKIPIDLFGSQDLFMLKASGDSMKNVGILNGTLLIVKKCEFVENGEIAIVMIDDEATAKRFYKRKNEIVLKAENESFEDIILKEARIIGKVVGAINKF